MVNERHSQDGEGGDEDLVIEEHNSGDDEQGEGATEDEYRWLAEQLSAFGQDPNADPDWTDPTGGQLQRLIEAAENGDEEAAQAAIQEKEGLDVNLPGPDGDTALHMASLMGSLSIVQLLLAHGAKASTRNTSDGSLAHHDAAASGYLDIVQTLTEASGPEALNVADNDGETPLHTAARGNHLQVVQWLIEKGACPKARNAEGQTPAEEADEQPVVDLIKSHQR